MHRCRHLAPASMDSPITPSACERSAFSIVELVFVLTIMAIVCAIAVPRYAGATQDYQIGMAAQRIVSDLALAQNRANYGSTSVTLTFNTTSNSYQIAGMTDPDRPTQTYTVNLNVEPYRSTLVSASFGGSNQITFDGYGTPTQGGTVIITSGAQQHTITVDPTSGRAFIQ